MQWLIEAEFLLVPMYERKVKGLDMLTKISGEIF